MNKNNSKSHFILKARILSGEASKKSDELISIFVKSLETLRNKNK